MNGKWPPFMITFESLHGHSLCVSVLRIMQMTLVNPSKSPSSNQLSNFQLTRGNFKSLIVIFKFSRIN